MKALDKTKQALAEDAVRRHQKLAQWYEERLPRLTAEIESAANLGAVRAAASFIPHTKASWKRWSGLCVRSEIKDFLRSTYLRRQELWGQDELEAILDERGKGDTVEERDALEGLLALLPARHRDLCRLVYRDGLSPYSAGQSLGVTGKHGCKIHGEALRILRDTLAA